MRRALWLTVAAIAAVASILAAVPALAASPQWTTYLSDNSRTGFNSAETAVTPSTAAGLKTHWSVTAGGSVSAEPIVAGGMVYYGSWDGNLHALTTSGTPVWTRSLGVTSDTSCNPPKVGVASTPTVSGGVVYVGGGNGSLYALSASTGAVIWKHSLGAPPATFLWSSPLVVGSHVYEGVSSFGDCPLIQGRVVELDAATGTVQNVLLTVPNGCTGASVWGSPTADPATGNIYFGTGNAGSCGASEPLAVAVVEASPSLSVLGSWQVPGNQQVSDSDFGSTPTMFTAGGTPMVGLQNKNGVYYAFQRDHLGSGPVWTHRMAVGGGCPQCKAGRADISPSTWDGSTLYVGGEQTTIKGVTCAGSVQALSPSGTTLWQHCLQSGPVLGAVVSVPGVVFVDAGTTSYAVRASNGSTLFRFTDSSSGAHFWGAPSISAGVVYLGNQDGKVFALGL